MENSNKNYEQPIQSQQVQSQTPQRQHVAFTQPSTSGRVVFNRSYLLSVAGIFRWLLIIFQFAGWVSAASVPVLKNGSYYLTDEFAATRSAYLFFSIVGFVGAIVLFVIHVFNVVHFGFLANVPWVLTVLITDLIWFIPTFILGIVSAVRESQYSSLDQNYQSLVNKGAFASASFFALLCAILYFADAGFHIVKIVKEGYKSKPPAAK